MRDNKNDYDCGVINVKQVVADWLRDNGYDGLYHESDCGCELSNLAPCESCCLECTPGHKIIDPNGSCGDFLIVPHKPEGE
jgi:hypothetical protein